MDYSFEVLISWSRDLNLYNRICLYRILLRISGFMIIILYSFMSCLSTSTSLLLLLYYTMCLSMLATWHSYHLSPGEFYLTPLDPHVQVMELGACGFSQLLIRVAQLKHGSPADRLELYPSRPPGVPLEFSFCKLVSACVLFILVHLFVISQLRISVM